MRISSKVDYAVRAVVELAAVGGSRPVKAEALASAQSIPLKFLLNILVELKRAGIVASQRGAEGGFRLAREASAISLADIIRAVEGPLAEVGDHRPEDIHYTGSAEPLQEVWIAVRAALRETLETVTIAHLSSGRLPASVRRFARAPDAWVSH